MGKTPEQADKEIFALYKKHTKDILKLIAQPESYWDKQPWDMRYKRVPWRSDQVVERRMTTKDE